MAGLAASWTRIARTDVGWALDRPQQASAGPGLDAAAGDCSASGTGHTALATRRSRRRDRGRL